MDILNLMSTKKACMLLVNKRCMFIRSWEEITPLTISNCPTNINVELTEIPNTNSVPTSGELTQAVNDLNLPDSLPMSSYIILKKKEVMK